MITLLSQSFLCPVYPFVPVFAATFQNLETYSLISQPSRFFLFTVSHVKAQYTYQTHPQKKTFSLSQICLFRNPLQFLITGNFSFKASVHKVFNHLLSYAKSSLLNMVSHARDFLTFVSKSSNIKRHSHGISFNAKLNIQRFYSFANRFFKINSFFFKPASKEYILLCILILR